MCIAPRIFSSYELQRPIYILIGIISKIYSIPIKKQGTSSKNKVGKFKSRSAIKVSMNSALTS